MERGKVGRAEVADFALLNEVVQGTEGLLDRGFGVGPVDLVEVYVVGVEASEAVFHGVENVVAGSASAVGVVVHGHNELGGYNQAVATTLDPISDHLLGLSEVIDVGGVDEVDAKVESLVKDSEGARLIIAAPEVVGPEADDGHFHSRISQDAVLHSYSLVSA